MIDQQEDNFEAEVDQFEQFIQQQGSKHLDDAPQIKSQNSHICSDMLSPYEITQVIGFRAVTIENTGVYYCSINHLSDLETEKLTAIGLAVLELQQKKCPLLIHRKVVPWLNHIEVVNPNNMILPQRMNIKLS